MAQPPRQHRPRLRLQHQHPAQHQPQPVDPVVRVVPVVDSVAGVVPQ